MVSTEWKKFSLRAVVGRRATLKIAHMLVGSFSAVPALAA